MLHASALAYIPSAKIQDYLSLRDQDSIREKVSKVAIGILAGFASLLVYLSLFAMVYIAAALSRIIDWVCPQEMSKRCRIPVMCMFYLTIDGLFYWNAAASGKTAQEYAKSLKNTPRAQRTFSAQVIKEHSKAYASVKNQCKAALHWNDK